MNDNRVSGLMSRISRLGSKVRSLKIRVVWLMSRMRRWGVKLNDLLLEIRV